MIHTDQLLRPHEISLKMELWLLPHTNWFYVSHIREMMPRLFVGPSCNDVDVDAR